MSNYIQSTNFATKDALSSGDPLKIVRGTEINTEFTNIAIAVATKLDTTALASPGPIGATTPSSINGTTGTFSGAVSGTTGTFSGNVQMASANGGQLAGLRNKIINGNMSVAQRGTVPFTVSLPAGGASQYTADRFEISQVTAATSASAVGGIISDNSLNGSSSTHIYLQTTVAKATLAAGDYGLIQQSIEGYNVADLKYGTASAKTVTISFKAAISSGPSTAVISVSLRNQVPNRSYVVPVTITNVAATYSITIPGDTSGTWLINNGVGLRVGFCCGAGATYTTTTGAWQAGSFIAATGTTNLLATATAAFNITDVQLEIGSVATPFEQRPIGMELALCQRYFQLLLNGGIGVSFSSVVLGRVTWPLFVPMRAGPTLAVFSGTPLFFQGSVTATHSSFSSTYITTTTAQADLNVSGGTATSGIVSIQKAESGVFSASAEL